MEHSHIFPVFSPNGSTWSLGQHPSEVAQGCPLGPLPVIYYSVLLCLGLPGKGCASRVSDRMHVSCTCSFALNVDWSLHLMLDARVTLCILIHGELVCRLE